MRLTLLCLIAGLAFCSALPWDDSNTDEEGTYMGSRATNCKCGWANKESGRIVGGKLARANEYPHMAALAKVYNRTVFPFCGASIIAARYLITAAHCTYGQTFKMTAIVGEHDFADDRESKYTAYYPVTAINHELYDPKKIINDIALLITDRPITFSQYVGPICLPVGPSPPEGSRIKVTGWGLTAHKGSPSNILLKVPLQIANLAKCSIAYPYNFINVYRPTQFCSYAYRRDSCQGDSGGPVTWLDPETNRYTLSGLVSFGRDCAGNDPGVNTDVYAFMPWIMNKMRGSNICQKV
uniref:Venom S1 protease 2 n=1 Tax=Lethocerus distinctifemur TaxID=280095 RepID=A0A2K8JU27_9HEMI|nr:venom S1 protease 2 [Lethocerus distinctifemur]